MELEIMSKKQLLFCPQHAQNFQLYPVFTVCGMLGSVNIECIMFSSSNFLLLFFLSSPSYLFCPMSLSICLVLLWTICPSWHNAR